MADFRTLFVNVNASLAGLGSPAEVAVAEQKRADSVRASNKPDYIVCLEDGKKLKMLRRHLMTHYGLTPDDYRAKWGLPKEYPMVAPAYAEKRRELAISIGLRSEEHTSELQSLMRISYAVFCLKKKIHQTHRLVKTRE